MSFKMGNKRELIMTDLSIQITGDILSLAEKKGYSNRELATRATITPSYIAHFRAGTRNLNMVTIEKLADALGAEASFNLIDKSEPEPEKQEELNYLDIIVEKLNLYSEEIRKKIIFCKDHKFNAESHVLQVKYDAIENIRRSISFVNRHNDKVEDINFIEE